MNDAEKIEALREWANTPSNHVCKQAQRQVRDIIDPPKPKWRELVDVWAGVVSTNSTLADVLGSLSGVARSERATGDRLAQIVAICEKRADDGWQADPDCVPTGHWGIAWLLKPLSQEPPNWGVLGNRSAAWLRSLTDEKPGTRTDAKYEHTLEPHCPVCFGVCAGSNRDGAA